MIESVTLFAAFGGGLISFLSPCVLPLVPVYLSVITGVNIWEDPAAAAFVRSVASGNETATTVRLGSRALVNPSAGQVFTVVASEAPGHLPDGYETLQPGRVARALTRLLGG